MYRFEEQGAGQNRLWLIVFPGFHNISLVASFLALATFVSPTPVLLPGKFHG